MATVNKGNIITIEAKSENSFCNAPKLTTRNRRKQKSGNGLMMIAILHLFLACGLIDSGMFLSIRFNHYGNIWPDSYVKLTISEFRFYRNQMLSIRLLYSPVTIAIGLMIFFPKSIYLLITFFSKVSFCRAMIVDGIISFLALIYACITGIHAYIILHSISKINIGDSSDILCYAIRGLREKAPQALRDRCLLVAYKMFGGSMRDLLRLHGDVFTANVSVVFLLLTLILLYIQYVKRHLYVNETMVKKKRQPTSVRICCVAGSGGHTAELLTIMSAFKEQLGYCIYIVSDTDKLSEQKIIEFEKSRGLRNFWVERISRSREVKQNYITSLFTAIWACFESLFLVWRIRPDVVLCNGPGVCLPICFASALFDLFRLRNVQIFYVESLCRIKRLSLTGKILYELRIPEIFFVHWEDLVQRYPRTVLIPSTEYK